MGDDFLTLQRQFLLSYHSTDIQKKRVSFFPSRKPQKAPEKPGSCGIHREPSRGPIMRSILSLISALRVNDLSCHTKEPGGSQIPSILALQKPAPAFQPEGFMRNTDSWFAGAFKSLRSTRETYPELPPLVSLVWMGNTKKTVIDLSASTLPCVRP